MLHFPFCFLQMSIILTWMPYYNGLVCGLAIQYIVHTYPYYSPLYSYGIVALDNRRKWDVYANLTFSAISEQFTFKTFVNPFPC